MLFSLHVISCFSCLFLWLISSFMPSWSEKMLEIIYILLNLLALTLCPSVWSVLENSSAHLKSMCVTSLLLLLCSFSRSVQSLSRVWLFAAPWTAARQASPSITNFRSLPKLTSIESVMPSNHLVLCCPLLLPPSIFCSIRVISNESVLEHVSRHMGSVGIEGGRSKSGACQM